MHIFELLQRLEGKLLSGQPDRHVTSVTRDSRRVDENTAFVAIRGASVDGHERIAELATAALIVVERDIPLPKDIPVIRVANTRQALATIAAALHHDPALSMRMVGITGTKGKTTTSALVEAAWRGARRRVGRIGTTGSYFDGVAIPSELTTPEAPELQQLLAQMRDQGGTDVVMEVSSIGLVQHRVDAIPFHTAVFTNFGSDHLDFHGDVSAYRQAKASLFQEHLRPIGGMPRVIASKEANFDLTGSIFPSDTCWYGFLDSNDIQISKVRIEQYRMLLDIHTPQGAIELSTSLLGRHNALNIAAALGVAWTTGISLQQAANGIEQLSGVDGRMQVLPNEHGLLVVVDYAHTPESLESALSTVRDVCKGRLWVVFGCGGDRDASKRPKMGEIAARLADVVVVTTDNPRSESPQQIIDHILSGIHRMVECNPDRSMAIRRAIQAAEPGDAILIAGKGHETYQEIAGIKYSFDDREWAYRALEGR